MEFSDRGPLPPTGPADVPTAGPPPPPALATGKARPGRLWAWALSAGLVAGLASWLGGESIRGMFEVTPLTGGGLSEPEELVAKNFRSRVAAQSRGGAWAFGMLGATLGLALGLAGGLSRRDPRAALTAGAIGLILAGAVGAGAAMGLVRLFFQNQDPQSNSLLFPLLVHGGIWSTIGLAAGLAFGIGVGGRGRVLRTGLSGLMGAIVSTLVFEVVGALSFPTAKTHYPVSEEAASRLLALLAVSLFVAAGAVLGAQDPRPNSARK
jgi:hypothetical protein